MRDALRVGREPRIARQFGHAERFDEPCERAVVAGAGRDRLVLARIDAVRRDRAVHVAGCDRNVAGGHPARADRMQHRQCRAEQVDVHMLPEAGARPFDQREQDARHGTQAGREIDDRKRHLERPAARFAVDRHEAGKALRDGVVARKPGERAVGAVAGDRTMDEAREALAQAVFVADAPALERALLEVVDQHVGRIEQAEQHVASVGMRQVEREIALVAVEPPVVAGESVRHRRAPVARFVALRRFDLDDVRAVVGECLRAERSRINTAQVHHAHARERAFVTAGHDNVSFDVDATHWPHRRDVLRVQPRAASSASTAARCSGVACANAWYDADRSSSVSRLVWRPSRSSRLVRRNAVPE